jgi:hypothetical protein
VSKKAVPENFHALVATLLADANRGLIGGASQVEKTELKTVSFRADPRPVMCLTVIYYKKQ